jgi:hypothetical protein
MPTPRPTGDIPQGVGNRYAVEFSISFETTKNWVDVSSTPNDVTRTRFETEVKKLLGRYGGVNTDGSSTCTGSFTQIKLCLLEENGDFYFEYAANAGGRRSAATTTTVRYESAEYWYVHDMKDELSRATTRLSFGQSLGAILRVREAYGVRGATRIADVAYATATGVATNGGGFADDMFAPVGPADGSDNNNNNNNDDASNDASSAGDDKDDNSFILYILIGLIACIAIGGVITICYLKKRKTQRRQAAQVRKGRAVDNPTYANGRPEGNAGPKPRQGQGSAPGLGPQQQQQQQRAQGGQVQNQGGRKVLVLDPYGNDA